MIISKFTNNLLNYLFVYLIILINEYKMGGVIGYRNFNTTDVTDQWIGVSRLNELIILKLTLSRIFKIFTKRL